MIQGSTYLVLEEGKRDGSARIVRHSSKKPALKADQLAVRINLHLPDDAFHRTPVASVTITENILEPVEVVADDCLGEDDA